MWNGDVVDDNRWDLVLLFCGCGVSVCIVNNNTFPDAVVA